MVDVAIWQDSFGILLGFFYIFEILIWLHLVYASLLHLIQIFYIELSWIHWISLHLYLITFSWIVELIYWSIILPFGHIFICNSVSNYHQVSLINFPNVTCPSLARWNPRAAASLLTLISQLRVQFSPFSPFLNRKWP